jgi:hypothetical protein
MHSKMMTVFVECVRLDLEKASCTLQVFQNFSNVPVLHYLQAVLFLKN